MMMNKRAALAFFLSLLVIIGYNYYIGKKYPAPEQKTPVQEQEGIPAAPALKMPASATQGPTLASGIAADAKDIVVESDLVVWVITSSGARIKSCQLKQFPEESLNDTRIKARIDEIEQALTQARPEAEEFLVHELARQKAILNSLKTTPEMAELVSPAATVSGDLPLSVILPAEERLNLNLNTALYQCSAQRIYLNERQSQAKLECVYQDAQGRGIKKTFTFYNSNYDIELEIELINLSTEDLLDKHLTLFIGPEVGLPQAQRGRRTYGHKGPLTYLLSGQTGWLQKEKYSRKDERTFVRREHSGQVAWTALENKYFLTALIPAQPGQAAIVERNKFGEQKVGLKIARREEDRYNFGVYLGPKKEEHLKILNVSLEKSIDYGLFSFIARLIYQILVFFSNWTQNFGWAIVLLCFVTKVVFYPLTHRSFESMQKMQQQMRTIQPELNALKEKYKGSPQNMNKEMMALYRKRGINPLASCQSGCLPMLLQLPVFFALYAVLYNSIELRGTPFIGWITDLSAKDPYYVLPILMGISMFVQQKLTGMDSASSAQQEQAKMMAFFLPVFLTWIFASLPSGVVLYWLSFNVLTSLQQLLIRRKQALSVQA